MASKKDYNKVVGKKAKRIAVVETVAASISANPANRKASLAIATDSTINRKRAAKAFDASARASAKKKKK